MWDGYMDYAGTEIINTARAVGYARNLGLVIGCEPCENVHLAVNDDEYLYPDQVGNEAPWYDRSIPESADFLGVVGMDLVGASTNPISRSTDPLIGDGSLLGTLKRTHRELAFTVMLVSRGECSLSYAMEWLASALRGGTCSASSCWGAQLCMFSCCPTGEFIPSVVGGDCVASVQAERSTSAFSADALAASDALIGTDRLRHLFDVGLLDGPTLSTSQYLPNGFVLSTVTFSMAASKPFIFREPLDTGLDWLDLSIGQVIGPYDPDTVYDQCPQFEPCLVDPTCPAPPLPPSAPIPRNPCYLTGPGLFKQTLMQVNPLFPPQWLEFVPVLEISTGNSPMRRLIIRFWGNAGGECTDLANNPCDACFDVNINYLPAGAQLVVDGRVQRATVGCPQGVQGFVQSTPTIYGAQGATFQWPVFDCPTGMCIQILTDSEFTDSNARARVQLVPRSDAA